LTVAPFVLGFALSAFAQPATFAAKPQTLQDKLARVFQEWERPDRPGAVAAIVEKGQVVFKRCFGQADVEYRIPTQPLTAFDVGQLAEVVTGMAVAMLEDRGKISAADPVKKYLPDLPACADGITLGHLITHTSGLPDWYDLMSAAGWNDGDAMTLEQVRKILKRQKELLFEPGTKSFASRTDYVLLAEVIRQVTGQSFQDWAWSEIFKPLGMTRTLFRGSYRETIEDRAHSINYSYRDGYLKGADNLGVVGSGGLFTTLDDFIKWVANLESPAVGSAAVKDKLLTPGKLGDGRNAGHSYGFAVDTYKGLERVHKSGAWGGFRTAFRYFPSASLAVFIFTNWDYAWYEPNTFADSAVDVCLKPLLEKPKAPPASSATKPKPVKLSPAQLAPYVGEYRFAGGQYLAFVEEKGVLVYKVASQAFRLVPLGEGRFAFENPKIPIVLTFSPGPGGRAGRVSFDEGTGEVMAPRVEREALSASDLSAYAGKYYCEELDARYEITPREGRLVLGSLRRDDIVLTPENRRTFVGGAAPFEVVLFEIGEKGGIIGFRVESESLSRLVFRKE
jgi:CubicO group peptidase (beta-lactamase class C family)